MDISKRDDSPPEWLRFLATFAAVIFAPSGIAIFPRLNEISAASTKDNPQQSCP